MKAGALRILPWIEKGQHAGASPRHAEEHPVEHRGGRERSVGKVLFLHAGEVEHHRRHHRANHGGAQIRLLENEHDEQQARQRGGQKRVAPIINLLHAVLQEPRKKEHQRGLCNLRRLEREEAELDPTMGGMRIAHQECAEQA